MTSVILFACIFCVSASEKRLLADSQTIQEQQIAKLEATVANLTATLDQNLATFQETISILNTKLQSAAVASYVRWGRDDCPAPAELIYSGFTAGKHWNSDGSGSDMLCLPSDPEWAGYEDGNYDRYRAHIFGSETDLPTSHNFFPSNINEQDMPCALCQVNKAVTAMLPARTSCYSGWTKEYGGYLMSGHYDRAGSYNHICMDGNPDFLQHGETNDNQNILYLVEAQCGSLPCPPYHQGRELACVVCSK